MEDFLSLLHKLRLGYQPALPKALNSLTSLLPAKQELSTQSDPKLDGLFPNTKSQPSLHFVEGNPPKPAAIRAGVVLSGGQAPGGHNVIAGLFDGLKKLHPQSLLFGFLDGPKGIIDNKHIELTETLLSQYRNQGGFDLIGSGRTKIETPEQFVAAENTVKELGLDGLAIIGGDDSNTNAALLAEYFRGRGVKTSVVGVPKTIDGDLKNEYIDLSFGFDTASKTFSEIIGNIARDALSAKKYYFFVKLMGRSASHITLECALQTHPNYAIISEEVEEQKKTLLDVTKDICNVIQARAAQGKDYGVVLIPEGIIEFIPECKLLIKELNNLLASDKPHAAKLDSLPSKEEKASYVKALLTAPSVNCFEAFPGDLQLQLLLDRDPHGNVQVSKIESERLFIETVKKELKQRKKEGKYNGKFSPQPLFCGYEGRSCLPSNFDCHYCYALGHVAALLINCSASGYMACVQNLESLVSDWQPAGIPLISMMTIEERHGKAKPVIRKALVNLAGQPFAKFRQSRQSWSINDEYSYPGPIQFFGPPELTESIAKTLQLEKHKVGAGFS